MTVFRAATLRIFFAIHAGAKELTLSPISTSLFRSIFGFVPIQRAYQFLISVMSFTICIRYPYWRILLPAAVISLNSGKHYDVI